LLGFSDELPPFRGYFHKPSAHHAGVSLHVSASLLEQFMLRTASRY
jgi:hypothetical protein